MLEPVPTNFKSSGLIHWSVPPEEPMVSEKTVVPISPMVISPKSPIRAVHMLSTKMFACFSHQRSRYAPGHSNYPF